MGRTKPIVSKDYIVGLTDGEGCFYVNLSKIKAYRSGWRIQLNFHIKLQEIDKSLLYAVRNTLNCGNVYFQREKRKNHVQCYRYTVSSQHDVFEKIIPFFKAHRLKTNSKNKNFKIFCQIARLVQQGKHLEVSGIEKICLLKSQMNQRTTGLA